MATYRAQTGEMETEKEKIGFRGEKRVVSGQVSRQKVGN